MINIAEDNMEFQRSEIISDLWKDLADNECEEFKAEEFVIDTTKPVVYITYRSQ